MFLYASIDGISLERAVLACIRDCHGSSKSGIEPVLVLVPTLRLADQIKRRLVDEFGAVLGVHVLTHRALATRAMEFALRVPPTMLPGAARLEILTALCEGEDGARRLAPLGDGVAAGLRQHSGTRRAALGAFGELRDAGVDAEALTAQTETRPLGEVYGAYLDALSTLERRGFTDGAGLIRTALPFIGPFLDAKGIRSVVHHGAYELTGVHVDLLRACEEAGDNRTALHYFLPGRETGVAYQVSARFVDVLERHFTVERRDISASRPAWEERLAGLHEVASEWEGGAEGAPELEIWNAQGTEAELRLAALRALAMHYRERVPLGDIAIVARSLNKYAPLLRSTLADVGLPFESSASESLRRAPGVAAFFQLLRVLARDFDRSTFIDLMRSGTVRLTDEDGKAENYVAAIDDWERWSRTFRVARGLDAWRRIPNLCQARRPNETSARGLVEPRAVELLSQMLETLGFYQEAWRGVTEPAEHVAILRRLVAEIFRPIPDSRSRADSRRQLDVVIDDFEMVARARGAVEATNPSWDMREVEEALERLVSERSTLIADGGGGGVHVIDVMQARGLVHQVVIWMGLQHGVFPARSQGNPFLDDGVRASLEHHTKRPLYAQDDRAMEERLLLATTLGSASHRVIVTFQRADDDGKMLARSSAFREVARVFAGRADVTRLLEEADGNPYRPLRVPAHPGERGTWAAREPRLGLVPQRDALLSSTVAVGHGVNSARAFFSALKESTPRVEATLEVVEKLEEFDPSDMSHDGVTGKGLSGDHVFSPSRIERLARCPLRFFLGHVLGLRALDEEPRPERAPKNVLGEAVHECLNSIFEQLPVEQFPDGIVPEGNDLEAVIGGLVKVLDEEWPRQWNAAFGPSATEFSGLLSTVGERWRASIARFLRADLESLSGQTITDLKCEVEIQGVLNLEGCDPIQLGGRLDRQFNVDGTPFIDDFKTSGSLKDRVKSLEIVRGNTLQLPLYRELVARDQGVAPVSVTARLLGVGPEQMEERVALGLDGEARDGFLETLAVAVALARAGRFPAHERPSDCSYCDFRRGCRKNHVPTSKRFEACADLRDYRDCKEKAKGKLTLATMRSNEKQKPEGKA